MALKLESSGARAAVMERQKRTSGSEAHSLVEGSRRVELGSSIDCKPLCGGSAIQEIAGWEPLAESPDGRMSLGK